MLSQAGYKSQPAIATLEIYTLHTGKLVKLMDKANFPFFSVSRDVRDALSTWIRPRVVGGREVRSEDADDAGNTTFMLFDFIFVRRRRT